MNTNRTFGIEFEVLSSIDRYELAENIQQALRNNGLHHLARATRWQSNTDQTNFNTWTVKTDISVSQGTTQNPYRIGAEVVSPILRGKEGIKAVRIVADVLNRFCKVNVSCGLHVHHGINRQELTSIANAWLNAEDIVLQAMPRSRRNNRYCARWNSMNVAGNPASHRMIANNKYLTLNLASFSLRTTIEFRCHSGTTEATKATNWILATQGFIEASIAGKDNNFRSIQDIASFINDDTESNNASEIANNFRRNSLRRQMIEFFAEQGPVTWADTCRHFGWRNASEAYTSALKLFRSRGFVNLDDQGYIRLNVTETPGSPEYRQAAEWLVSRFNHFNG